MLFARNILQVWQLQILEALRVLEVGQGMLLQ
jgi:hypothetical protein